MQGVQKDDLPRLQRERAGMMGWLVPVLFHLRRRKRIELEEEEEVKEAQIIIARGPVTVIDKRSIDVTVASGVCPTCHGTGNTLLHDGYRSLCPTCLGGGRHD